MSDHLRINHSAINFLAGHSLKCETILVVVFEGFRHKSQFIPKGIFVRGANYKDTILMQPSVEFSLLAGKD